MGDRHVKYLVLGSPFDLLKNVATLKEFLERLVGVAGMRALDEAKVYDVKQTLLSQGMKPYPDEPEGVSGICVLSTSHAAVHTYPHRAYGVVDLYSCRDFDAEETGKFICREMEAKEVKSVDLSYSMQELESKPIVYPVIHREDI